MGAPGGVRLFARKAAGGASFAVLLMVGACQAMAADALPSDTTIYEEDDGDDCPADPVPLEVTGAGLAI